MRMTDNPLSRTAQSKMSKPRVTAGGHNYQVDALLLRELTDFFEWTALAGMDFSFVQLDRIFPGYSLQISPDEAVSFAFREDEGETGHISQRIIWLRDMSQVQVGSKGFYQGQGVLESLQGSGGKIRWDQDFSDAKKTSI